MLQIPKLAKMRVRKNCHKIAQNIIFVTIIRNQELFRVFNEHSAGMFRVSRTKKTRRKITYCHEITRNILCVTIIRKQELSRVFNEGLQKEDLCITRSYAIPEIKLVRH